MNIPGREEYGKFVAQPTATGNPGSWELIFDGLLLAIYDTASKSGSLDNRNISKIMNRPPLQRLYTWKDLLHDRRMLFDKCFRKGYYFQFPFDITALEKVWFKILAIINDDVNSLDFNIVYEKKRASLKGVLYTVDPKIYKIVHYGYEELQEKVDSLIAYFEEKGGGSAEIQNNEQSANEISGTLNRQAYRATMKQSKIDVKLRVKKISSLEEEIGLYAKKYKLWKKRHKTIDDLYATVKQAVHWQDKSYGTFVGTILTLIFGPMTRNIELNNLYEKRKTILEEIRELNVMNLAFEENLKNQKQDNADAKEYVNPKAISSDPNDIRNKLLELKQDCFVKDENGEYRVPRGKDHQFVELCVAKGYLRRLNDTKNQFDLKWIYANVNISLAMAEFKKYLSQASLPDD